MLGFRYQGGTYAVLLFRLLLALLFMSLTRLIFYLFNLQYFNDIDSYGLFLAFAGGIRFDISSLIVLNSLYILMMILPGPFRTGRFWQPSANLIYYVVNILAFSLNIIDTVYFRFTSKRMTADIFSFIQTGEDDLMSLIPKFLSDFAWEILAWILLSAIFIRIASWMKVKKEEIREPLKYYFVGIAAFLFAGSVSIIGIRGGFQLRPITIINAGNYSNAKNVSLVLNTPFSIIKSYGHTGLKYMNYFAGQEDAARVFDPEVMPADPAGVFKTLNVVIIIMESFSTEYIGALNQDSQAVSYTPSLDTVISNALTFKAYANGKQSMEALPAIIAGIPSLITRPYITSAYGSNRISSLAKLLVDKGYETSFFHGGRNGTMGFESFTEMAGFEHYYGKDEYGNDDDFDGNWGIYDGPFFEFFRDKLDSMPQPFLSAIFSLSSHHPYMVPEEYAGKFDKGTLDIHESIMYSDHILGKFLREAESSAWFENTLFVITADHTSLSDGKEYQTRSGIYAVPLVFYKPGAISPEISDDIAQHTDILGSVLGYLDYDEGYVSFGNNLFDPNGKRFSVNYLNGNYQLLKDDWSLHFDGNKATGLFALEKENPENVIDLHVNVAGEMENFLKAIIQQYNYRMINNKLTPDPDND